MIEDKGMADFVSSIDEIVDNIERMRSYANGSPEARRFHNGRIKNGKIFAVLVKDGEMFFAPSKFVGYANNDLTHLDKPNNKDGRKTDRILEKLIGKERGPKDEEYSEIDSQFLDYCKRWNIVPSEHHQARRYWKIDFQELQFHYPEEVEAYLEGAVQKVQVNRYERDRRARAACIEAHGTRCKACDLDFGERYGDTGKGYIHVHHLVKLSDIQKTYKVDPKNDLVPVCPNCHAMIHKNDPLLSIAELKQLLNQASAKTK